MMFEYFIHNMSSAEGKAAYDKFLKITTDSKQDLMTSADYDEIVIEDPYNIFLKAV